MFIYRKVVQNKYHICSRVESRDSWSCDVIYETYSLSHLSRASINVELSKLSKTLALLILESCFETMCFEKKKSSLLVCYTQHVCWINNALSDTSQINHFKMSEEILQRLTLPLNQTRVLFDLCITGASGQHKDETEQ